MISMLTTSANSNRPAATEFSAIEDFRGSAAAQDQNSPKPKVFRAQSLLRELEYEPGPRDGILGPRTLAALRQFYRDEGELYSDGVNDRTIELLLASVARRPTVVSTPSHGTTTSNAVGSRTTPQSGASASTDRSNQERDAAEVGSSPQSRSEEGAGGAFLREVGRFFGVVGSNDVKNQRKYCRDNPRSQYFDPNRGIFVACN